jgi:hypothetical protein
MFDIQATTKSKYYDHIGYNGFIFLHEYSGEGRWFLFPHEYSGEGRGAKGRHLSTNAEKETHYI